MNLSLTWLSLKEKIKPEQESNIIDINCNVNFSSLKFRKHIQFAHKFNDMDNNLCFHFKMNSCSEMIIIKATTVLHNINVCAWRIAKFNWMIFGDIKLLLKTLIVAKVNCKLDGIFVLFCFTLSPSFQISNYIVIVLTCFFWRRKGGGIIVLPTSNSPWNRHVLFLFSMSCRSNYNGRPTILSLKFILITCIYFENYSQIDDNMLHTHTI